MASSAVTTATTPAIANGSTNNTSTLAPAFSKSNTGYPGPLSPGLSPTSIAFPYSSGHPTSPKRLPPILGPHVPKNINSGLMSTARQSLSPRPMHQSLEGTSQNPAAVLRNSSPGFSKITDGPPSVTSPSYTTSKPMNDASPSSNSLHPSAAAQRPTSPGPSNVASDGSSMNIDATLNNPPSTPGASQQAITTSTPGPDSTPSRPRMSSISETLNPITFPNGPNTPSTPYSPIERGSMSSILENRGSMSSVSGSGSRAKHECPNCHQTFTRHHNLKSHLLTHSHEKPFQCETCQSRFRRLHDLKRHQKLHTGERPHVCSSCGRKFARGDALARHLRGEGGCAGRRTSMGGMPEEGYDPNDDSMDLEFAEGDELDDEMPDLDENGISNNNKGGRRTASLPNSRSRRRSSNRASQMNSQGLQPFSAPHAPLEHRVSHHTYPPVQDQAFNSLHQAGNSTTSTSQTSNSLTSNAMTSTAPSTITSSVLTDSPRALSPSNPSIALPEGNFSLNRNRSPSFTSVHHQAVENRRRSNAPGTSIPPPPSGFSLPQPNSMNNQHQQSSSRSHSTSLPIPNSRPNQYPTSSSGQAPVGLGNIFSSGEDGIWAYIQNMEKRIRDLEDRNNQMEARVAALSAERHHQHQQQQQPLPQLHQHQQQREPPATAASIAQATINPVQA